MISQKELKKLLHYNPDTGVFIWIKRTSNSVKVGSVAGSFDKDGYRRIQIKGRGYRAHRLAFLYMTGAFPKHQVDHKKHIKHDNRWSEIREATNQENGKNRPLNKNNKSGTSGVSWNKENKKWYSYIKVNSIQRGLGFFEDKFESICARKSAENKYNYHENHGAAT